MALFWLIVIPALTLIMYCLQLVRDNRWPPLVTRLVQLNRLVINPNVLKQKQWHNLNSNMRITGAKNQIIESQDDNNRKLVIMMTWLLAKPKHVQKFVDLYTCRGFDVLTVGLSPVQFMFPAIGAHRVRDNLLAFLVTNSSIYSKYVIHGSSVGAYLSSELLTSLQNQQSNEINEIKTKVAGSVYDSIVDPEYTPYSFARSLTHSFAAAHYQVATESFYQTPIKTPALLLASQKDVLSNPEIVYKVEKVWKSRGIDVSVKMWPDSKHVGHLAAYPVEYEKTINHFLQRINLI